MCGFTFSCIAARYMFAWIFEIKFSRYLYERWCHLFFQPHPPFLLLSCHAPLLPCSTSFYPKCSCEPLRHWRAISHWSSYGCKDSKVYGLNNLGWKSQVWGYIVSHTTYIPFLLATHISYCAPYDSSQSSGSCLIEKL